MLQTLHDAPPERSNFVKLTPLVTAKFSVLLADDHDIWCRGIHSIYLLKGLSRSELIAALRAASRGETLTESFGGCQRGAVPLVVPSPCQDADIIQPLSQREIDVLGLASTGLGNREIGARLFVTENTVKTHMAHITRKLGVVDRVQAAVWAARNGLIPVAS